MPQVQQSHHCVSHACVCVCVCVCACVVVLRERPWWVRTMLVMLSAPSHDLLSLRPTPSYRLSVRSRTTHFTSLNCQHSLHPASSPRLPCVSCVRPLMAALAPASPPPWWGTTAAAAWWCGRRGRRRSRRPGQGARRPVSRAGPGVGGCASEVGGDEVLEQRVHVTKQRGGHDGVEHRVHCSRIAALVVAGQHPLRTASTQAGRTQQPSVLYDGMRCECECKCGCEWVVA